ncbi:MAG: hypothetical protein ACYC2U_07270 [Candidatus Amoebophilus sp.]
MATISGSRDRRYDHWTCVCVCVCVCARARVCMRARGCSVFTVCMCLTLLVHCLSWNHVVMWSDCMLLCPGAPQWNQQHHPPPERTAPCSAHAHTHAQACTRTHARTQFSACC